MHPGIVVVAEEEDESDEAVDEQAERAGDEPGPPNLHRVEKREAEHEAARDAARIFAEGLHD